MTTKESEHVKYFEAAIWEETSSVHLYEFGNGYDLLYDLRGIPRTDREKIDYREQFEVEVHGEMPPAYTAARRDFLQSALQDYASYLVERYPDSEHHLMYNGHGGPGGRLFESQLSREDADRLLESWRTALTRPLGAIDMGGPCKKGGFSDLENFCRHARFYIASDLPNGGYTFDDRTIEKHRETHPEAQYHRLLGESGTFQDASEARIDLRRKSYEYSLKGMTAGKVEQANCLYSCTGFERFGPEFRSFLQTAGEGDASGGDLYRYMLDNGADGALFELFSGVIVHRADNRDFFEWEAVANGLSMPSDQAHRGQGRPVAGNNDGD